MNNQTCAKHKLPAIYTCTLPGCKRQKLMCYKCNTDHKKHQENIILIEIEDQDLKDSYALYNNNNNKNKNNKRQGIETMDSPSIYYNLANLHLRTHSQSSNGDASMKKNTVKNDACVVTEFKSNSDSNQAKQRDGKQHLPIQDKRETIIINSKKAEASCSRIDQPYQIMIKEEEDTESECFYQNSNTDIDVVNDIDQLVRAKQLNENNNNNNNNNKCTKESVLTRVIGKDSTSHTRKLPPNTSYQLSKPNIVSQIPSTSKNAQANQSPKERKISFPQLPTPSHHQQCIFDSYFQFSHDQLLQQHPTVCQKGMNNNSNGYPQIYLQQNHYNLIMPPKQQPHLPSPNCFYPHQHQHHHNIHPQSTFAAENNDQQEINQHENEMSTQARNCSQTNDRKDNTQDFLSQKERESNNRCFSEQFKHNENVQKICLFLKNLNDMKLILSDKVDAIKNSFLDQISMEETDFNFSFLTDSSINSSDISNKNNKNNKNNNEENEDILKSDLTKIDHLNNFFKQNKVCFNASATSRSKQQYLEQELDQILSFTIEQISGEMLEQQSLSDEFFNNAEYDAILSYYNKNSVVDLEEIKDKINFFQPYQLEFDGSSKGNPGVSGSGFLIRDPSSESESESILVEYSVDVGVKTSNQAEYLALIYGMYTCYKLGIKQLRILGDSEVIIKQMQGVFQVRSLQLKDYYNLARLIHQCFHSVDYIHVKRQFNAHADALAHQPFI